MLVISNWSCLLGLICNNRTIFQVDQCMRFFRKCKPLSQDQLIRAVYRVSGFHGNPSEKQKGDLKFFLDYLYFSYNLMQKNVLVVMKFYENYLFYLMLHPFAYTNSKVCNLQRWGFLGGATFPTHICNVQRVSHDHMHYYFIQWRWRKAPKFQISIVFWFVGNLEPPLPSASLDMTLPTYAINKVMTLC